MDFTIVMSQKAEILKGIIKSKLNKNPNELIDVSVLLTRCALDIICGNFTNIIVYNCRIVCIQ